MISFAGIFEKDGTRLADISETTLGGCAGLLLMVISWRVLIRVIVCVTLLYGVILQAMTGTSIPD